MTVSLRDWPYPYHAALTISNDADWMQWQTFIDIHTYLNTARDTPLGKGLNLEIADSFFPFTEDTSCEFSYFADFAGNPGPHAPEIRELIQAGYIDTLHTYGDFDQRIRFERRLAEITLDDFSKNGVQLQVWVNHGTVNNIQNIGGSTGYYHHGDLNYSSAYHTDLTTRYGIKYYWNDTILTPCFALARQTPTRRRLLQAVPGANFAGRVWRRVSRKLRRLLSIPAPPQKLYTLHVLRDGSKLINFVRFRYNEPLRYAPHARTLQLQLTSQNIGKLFRQRGAAVIYQHLGTYRDDQGKLVNNTPPYFDADQLRCFEQLRQLHDEGKLFITSVRRLLNYARITDHLNYTVASENGWQRIDIRGVNCPLAGKTPVSVEEIQGVTFYTPDPEKTEVYLNGILLSRQVQKNGPDHSGRKSVSVRWDRTDWPL